MASYVVRSPYFLETANGNIELSKGMYICLVHRKGLLPKSTTLKKGTRDEDSFKTTCRINLQSYRKKIVKASTTKRLCQKKPRGRTSIAGSVTLRKGPHNFTFELFDEAGLFPPSITQFYIPINVDNDCSSDEQEVQKSIKNMLMSLCLATYDNKYSGSK